MIRGLLAFALFVVLLHVGYVFASPMVKNTMLERKMREVARAKAVKSETSILRDIMSFVYDKGIELDQQDLVIVLRQDKATIAAHYTTDVSFWSYSYRHEFFPASDESARMTWKRAGRKALQNY